MQTSNCFKYVHRQAGLALLLGSVDIQFLAIYTDSQEISPNEKSPFQSMRPKIGLIKIFCFVK